MCCVEVNGCTLYHGDCLEILPQLRDIDCLATDPPYGVAYQTSHRKKMATPKMLANDDRPHVFWLLAAVRALKVGSAAYVFTAAKTMGIWQAAMAVAGLRVKTPIIWDKGTHTASDLYGDYGCRTEMILYGTKGRHIFRNGRRENNLWFVPRDPAGDHPTPKPVALMRRILTQSTAEGDVVLDPFMGSGATGVACVEMGRRFIGVEIDETYFDLACRRISAARRQYDLFKDEGFEQAAFPFSKMEAL